MPGRFFLGVGTGENLNEHILGDRWIPGDLRLEMLEEAIELMRERAGEETPPLAPDSGGPLRTEELRTGVGSREKL